MNKDLEKQWKDIMTKIKELNNLKIENDEIVTTERKESK